MLLAILVGLVSGYYGGFVDNILMRITEIFLVIPFLLILLVFLRVITAVAPSGVGGLSTVMLMIGLFSWASNARIIRGEVLRVKESEFIEASKSLGASKRRIIFRHIFPNVLHIIIVLTTLMIATAILVEAAVSFLGFGDPTAESQRSCEGSMVGRGLPRLVHHSASSRIQFTWKWIARRLRPPS
jgi:ABC-type dipeptide/oligopeptide/nickel transport system permease subunit